MTDDYINQAFIEIGLANADGREFERFVHAFFPAIDGRDFVPLGGHHDGGADAMIGESIWSDDRHGIYYQASTQKDYKRKIRHTIGRLRESQRNPRELVYVTNQRVPGLDELERKLSMELQVYIRIRDASYIMNQVNSSVQTRGAFREFLGHHVEASAQQSRFASLAPSPYAKSASVLVFLRQEIDRHSGNFSLANAITDSLILWALEDSDPDRGVLYTRDEIVEKIRSEFPSSESIVVSQIDSRLKLLSSKKNHDGREIRRYPRNDSYCLPHTARMKICSENAEEEALRIRVLSHLEDRIVRAQFMLDENECRESAEAALRAIHFAFEREGVEFLTFLSDNNESSGALSIPKSVDYALSKSKGLQPGRLAIVKEAVLHALRDSFYNSTDDERILFGKLSKTYSLIFALHGNTQTIKYFEEMKRHLYLYVGSDLIVRALAERYVRKEDQKVRTLLLMLVRSGATLVLSEPVLEEVVNHLRITMIEYTNLYDGNEDGLTDEIVFNSSKILIRAYFYAKRRPSPGSNPPKNWHSYVNQFCDPRQLRTHGKEDLRNYLSSQFGMTYEPRKNLESMVSDEESRNLLHRLTEKLKEHKSNDELASNDALLALAVYMRRRHRKERAIPFGYQTWWLTTETSITKYTKALESNNSNARYIMRPEFALKFLALLPRSDDLNKTFESIFPSLLGMRLANRVKNDLYVSMMKEIKEALDLEPGRREALISRLSDQLKSSQSKQYEVKLDVDMFLTYDDEDTLSS